MSAASPAITATMNTATALMRSTMNLTSNCDNALATIAKIPIGASSSTQRTIRIRACVAASARSVRA